MPRKVRRTRLRLGMGGVVTAAALLGGGAAQAGAVTLVRSDLDFILQQIRTAEAHAGGGQLLGGGANQVPDPLLPYGLRAVDGSDNNLTPGRAALGSADRAFPRLLTPKWIAGEELTIDPDGPAPGGQATGDATGYAQTTGFVEDSRPRTISNLVADQTAANPAAVAAADGTDGSSAVDHDGNAATPDLLEIVNTTPDEGLSAPYNSWFTLFGQFFDHGLDLVPKGGSGLVYVPLKPDDPLLVGADGEAGTADDPATVPPPHMRFMALTRATNEPGPDGVLGDNPSTPLVDESADDVHEHTNTTTPFVDQNQTYTSHPSHQVFLREYALNGAGAPVSTGRLLDDDAVHEGIGSWDAVKDQARTKLGIILEDTDVLNVPLLRTDPYGRFIPGPNGYPQIATETGFVEGSAGGTAIPANALRTNHAFLDDISHHAVPKGDHDGNPATPAQALAPDANPGTTDDHNPATYDDELLGKHFITGDGRGNENIGLTAVHHVFHAEHNRMVGHITNLVSASGDPAFIAQWQLSPGVWNGERLFQAARFVTEMQYQHLVFEEFARKIQPQVNVFAGYATDIDPRISAEFAHVVYRFGHSMLNETVPRTNADGSLNDIGLIEAFLNPVEYYDGGTAGALNSREAAGAIVNGTTRQRGNELDEFVTEALRNNLLGLPLDLPTLNLARGRDTGMPGLNAARRQFHAATNHSALEPYVSWNDFKTGLRNHESLINFVAAYGTHPMITAETSFHARRAAATAIVTNQPVTLGARTFDPPLDRIEFLTSQGPWQNDPQGVTVTGIDDIDFWMGGLAERPMPFGGLLGSSFNYVFETQMERLQDGDRFYYLHRLAGLNLLNQLEENSFAEIIMRNTDGHGRLPHDVFSRPDFIIEAGDPSTWVIPNDPSTPANEFRQLAELQGGTLRFTGGEHIVMGGTAGSDKMRADDGDDTLWGEGGRDRLEGGAGVDAINGGDGDDILTDAFGDDNIKGGDGDDAINAGSGFDLILAGSGADFVIAGADPKETFGGQGGDFVHAGDSADTVFGGDGDDWIEGGDQADLLQGGNGDPFQQDTRDGNDVIDGQSGNDDYDAEGGDDIMVSGAGTERHEGMLGFDWATAKGVASADLDMSRRVFVRPDEDTIRDRFDQVEGVSGWHGDDILRGDSRDATAGAGAEGTMVGHELTDPALIDGLQPILGPGVTRFAQGNIILGGGGSDVLEGRGGNDIIDGDAALNVALEAPDVSTPSPSDTRRADRMSELQADVFAGRLDPGAIRIVREIVTPTPGPADVDTAEFSGPIADYDIIASGDVPGVVSVVHARGTGIDGTDTLRNVERARFADETVEIVDLPTNDPATGAPEVSDTTPTEGAPLTASIGTVADADTIDMDSLRFSWQVEERAGEWATIATGTEFTPSALEEGAALRVVVTFRDGDGVLESRASAPTDPVENVNDAPTGAPVLTDTTPTVGQGGTVLTGSIGDADGLTGAVFALQWQADDGSGFADIPGATDPVFVPDAGLIGSPLRVVVSFTDDNGTDEQLTSAPSAPVVAAPPPPPSATGPAILALRSAAVPRTIRAAAVSAGALRVRITPGPRTTVVRIRVFRAGARKALATAFVPASKGTMRVALRQRSIVRVLRRGGTFRIEMTPGASRRALGRPTVRTITVRR